MRTTINLAPDLLDQAKQRALDHHCTLSDVVNSALRQAFDRCSDRCVTYQTVTFGSAGNPIPDPDATAAMQADEDLEWLKRKSGIPTTDERTP